VSLETAGFVLLGLGLAILIADAFVGFGIVTDVAGPIVLGAGAILLVHEHGYDPPGWLTALLVASVAVFIVSTGIAFRRARRAVFSGDAITMVGRSGIARTDLSPEGLVAIKGEQWPAQAARGLIPKGERVLVTGYDGSRLLVDVDGAGRSTRAAGLPRRL
jgi:membrane-bound serine protease (ClpP class)